MRILSILSWTVCFYILIIVTNGKIPNKIIGGEPVSIVDYKHQVSVQAQNVHICGGTIIGNRHVLTSAACVSSEVSDEFHVTYAGIKVLSGTTDLLQDGQFDSRMLNDVSYIIHHEEYNSRNFFIHDIAILKLAKPFSFDSFRNEVSLSSVRENRKEVYITGWGENSAEYITKYLQYLDARSLGARKCKLWYQKQYKLCTTQACILPQLPMSRITQGNSGSAIMKAHKIFGVLSLTNTNPHMPAIYTHTFQYYDWVEKNIGVF